MRKYLFILALFMISLKGSGRETQGQDTIIYLFPGQGGDYRLFKYLQIPPGYDTVHMVLPVPEKHETLSTYASRFIQEIDLSSPYILMGVSLGGMICTELSETLSPLKTIIISSAKTTGELPKRYTFQQKFPINRVIPKRLTKAGARLLQGIVEPNRKYNKETYKDMLKKKDPLYLKRTADMIINWDRTTYTSQIVHIHGDKDHTIPIKNVDYDYLVKEGSHMMIMTRATEISGIVGQVMRKHEEN